MATKSWTQGIDFGALRREIDAVPHGQKKAYQEQLATKIGISYVTLRREMARQFGKKKEVEREEQVPGDLVQLIAEIKEEYKTMTLKEDNRTLSTKRAQRIAAEEGREDALDWHESTLNAALRRRGYHLPEHRRRVEPDHAGQQFQLDFSRSKHFQIIEPIGGNDWLLKPTAQSLHYKDGGARVRTWICQLRDEYSRLRLVQYYPATSESAILGVHFLKWCWQRPGDDHLMNELPERLKADQGTFMKSKIATRLLDKLNVKKIMAAPGNPKSQGKVERGFRSLWHYEAEVATRLIRAGKDKVKLSTVRRYIHDLMIQEHDKTHPVRSGTRGDAYQQSLLRHSLRTVDADLLDLAARTWERRADATCKITIDGVPYEVPYFAAEQSVRVHRHPDGRLVGELVDGYRAGDPFQITPYEFADLDEQRERRQTYAEEIAEQARENQKVRALKPEPENEDPETVFDEPQAQGGPVRVRLFDARERVGQILHQHLPGDRADHHLRRLVEEGVLYDNMPEPQLDEVLELIRNEEHALYKLPLQEARSRLQGFLEKRDLSSARAAARVRMIEQQGLIWDDMTESDLRELIEQIAPGSGPDRRAVG
jgi:transposase InsO family protein